MAQLRYQQAPTQLVGDFSNLVGGILDLHEPPMPRPPRPRYTTPVLNDGMEEHIPHHETPARTGGNFLDFHEPPVTPAPRARFLTPVVNGIEEHIESHVTPPRDVCAWVDALEPPYQSALEPPSESELDEAFVTFTNAADYDSPGGDESPSSPGAYPSPTASHPASSGRDNAAVEEEHQEDDGGLEADVPSSGASTPTAMQGNHGDMVDNADDAQHENNADDPEVDTLPPVGAPTTASAQPAKRRREMRRVAARCQLVSTLNNTAPKERFRNDTKGERGHRRSGAPLVAGTATQAWLDRSRDEDERVAALHEAQAHRQETIRLARRRMGRNA